MTEFTITSIIGGTDASNVIKRMIIIQLRRKIKILAERFYSKEVKSFDIKFLVEGEISKYKDENSGISRLRFSSKKREITADLLIKHSEWKNWKEFEDEKIAELLSHKISSCYKQMIEYLKKKKIEINGDNLLEDIEKVFPASPSIH